MVPDEAIRHADSVVIGEAEWVWTQVVSDLENGVLQPTYAGERGSHDEIPAPRRDLLSKHYMVATVNAARNDFLNTSGVDAPALTVLTPLPGTVLWTKMQSENRVTYRRFPDDWVYRQHPCRDQTRRDVGGRASQRVRLPRPEQYSRIRIARRLFSTLIRTGSLMAAVLACARNTGYRALKVRRDDFDSCHCDDPVGSEHRLAIDQPARSAERVPLHHPDSQGEVAVEPRAVAEGFVGAASAEVGPRTTMQRDLTEIKGLAAEMRRSHAAAGEPTVSAR